MGQTSRQIDVALKKNYPLQHNIGHPNGNKNNTVNLEGKGSERQIFQSEQKVSVGYFFPSAKFISVWRSGQNPGGGDW